ncbi:MAG TPA: dephospho-CoA kinase [Acidobacteriaceae bacterium]|jgi:dephospho-CoA kinase
MLRVGLTGGLGSGKSTAAQMFAGLGAHVFSADEIGRQLMQPGEAVFAAIIAHFGARMVRADGTLDRVALAQIAFGEGRIEELNTIVHPATIARQAALIEEIAAREPDAVAIVESALIFETKHGGDDGWQKRFDRIIFVKASEGLKIERFVRRSAAGRALNREERDALEADARRRMARQAETERNAARCDYVLANDGSVEHLKDQVEALWPVLKAAAKT